ncbi:hypothetical protein HMPREF0491_01496 [Lachnospiraceae oral taxon 107 str. F0167]|jgi:hypothetical protein|uniref:hypothetical protein n=1 Tax=Lachnoanaerobaculum sp. Marseille-Q4761 TaxID=2819511 RepID=UPI0002083680|nr:hypothetical protein [Lachnoanaerobaculum sp. Marseille-Q4761]EGG92332.1 hypothetical protein HMPREF0491_01496 [Lachnospiraceae oral taxon 107 str. F0167]MBO1869573.1 hypothetical protein [Lachnoanaerobaculum sp. Marseille-Q4761]RKW39179.1 MAG: hypothetical protein D8H95_39210 [Lachnospiraceae bacterium]
MWLLFGGGAVIFAFLNIVLTLGDRSPRLFGFISLSLTALTVCSFYSDGARRLAEDDLSGLRDIMPIMSYVLWFCTIMSILLNAIPFLKSKRK